MEVWDGGFVGLEGRMDGTERAFVFGSVKMLFAAVFDSDALVIL